MSECSALGCERSARARGWCLPHYKRWRRRGSVHDITAEERFFARVTEDENGCWNWHRAAPNGYGSFAEKRNKPVPAHRWSYEFMRVEIPDGLVIDHLCRNRLCVNPWHLDPVTQRENVMRADGPSALNARKTKCLRGHPLDAANTYVCPRGKRECRICRNAATARSKSRRAVGAVSGG